MAEPDGPQSEPQQSTKQKLFRRVFGRTGSSGRRNGSTSRSEPVGASSSLLSDQEDGDDADDDADRGDTEADAERSEAQKPSISRHGWGHVVPGLPRTQTFQRRLSEDRAHLAPIQPSVDERRAVSMDRRSHGFRGARAIPVGGPRDTVSDVATSQHELQHEHEQQHSSLPTDVPALQVPPLPLSDAVGEEIVPDHATSTGLSTDHGTETVDTFSDVHSISDSLYDAQIRDDLEKRWILNLSMHFKDHSRREKFFVTYRQSEHVWRRVTVSLDYRNAPPNSLEMDLIHTKFQRDKNQKIYEAIRESLLDIHFFDTVTNLKLETTDGRLHVHVVEDGNEIIPYPPVSQVAHLGCRRVSELDVEFDSHMSGFVYKVNVGGQILIKKEIPSPETIEEFLYEINALNSLSYSENVINFHGVVVDEYDEYVKGLLISFADGGALIDVIYDNCKEPSGNGLAWSVRERWARQIVSGLADIHESGFVQGDFTLSNIVIDDKDDAKIIDINRRGCPVGWEPPEATPLLDSNHRISMYIGIKSDLYQLGMVLWALAMEDDEPDLEPRPLLLGPEAKVPEWYRVLTETCLNPDPRRRMQASQLTQLFPLEEGRPEHISVDDGLSLKSYYVDECSTVRPPGDWPHYSAQFLPNGPPAYESWNYPPRGRSPPSPLPSNPDMTEAHRGPYSPTAWAAHRFIRPSYSDAGVEDIRPDDMAHNFTPTPTADRIEFPEGGLRIDEEEAGEHPSADTTPTKPRDDILAGEESGERERNTVAALSDGLTSSVLAKDMSAHTDKFDDPITSGDKHWGHEDSVEAPPVATYADEMATGHLLKTESESESNGGAAPASEAINLNHDAEKGADTAVDAVDVVATEGGTADSDDTQGPSKEEAKGDTGDSVVEELPRGADISSSATAGAEESSGGAKSDEIVVMDANNGMPRREPEQPEAQAELTPDKDGSPRDDGHTSAQGLATQVAEQTAQTPGQQAMPVSESCPSGKLDVSELVNGDDVQEPHSSDPPDDSSPSYEQQQSGIQDEEPLSEMPALAETSDQQPVVIETTAGAEPDEATAIGAETLTEGLPEPLAGIGTGLPSVDTNVTSERDLLDDDNDDSHATRQS